MAVSMTCISCVFTSLFHELPGTHVNCRKCGKALGLIPSPPDLKPEPENPELPLVGRIYRYYMGDLFTVLAHADVAIISDDLSQKTVGTYRGVVYQSNKTGEIYVGPIKDWQEHVISDGEYVRKYERVRG